MVIKLTKVSQQWLKTVNKPKGNTEKPKIGIDGQNLDILTDFITENLKTTGCNFFSNLY